MVHDKERSMSKLAGIATAVLAALGALCVLGLVYGMYQRAGSTPEPPGRFENFLNYAPPALFAALLLGSLRARPAWRINLALAVLSTGVSLFAANLLLMAYDTRIAAAHRTLDGSSERDIREVVKLAKKFGVEYDARGRLAVLEDLSRRGIDAVPLVAPVNVLKDSSEDGTRRSSILIDGKEVLPLGGVSDRTTVYCNEGGQYIIYKSDEHGFHNPPGLWGTRPLDAVAVGDSFTQGACVPSEKNFVALIRGKLPRTLNLGMGGNGPLTALGTIEEFLGELTPRLVLWFYFEGNDIWDLSRENDASLLLRYFAGDFHQSLLRRQAEIDRALVSFIEAEKAQFDFAFPDGGNVSTAFLRRTVDEVWNLVRLRHLRERLNRNRQRPGEYRRDPRTRAAMEMLPSALSRAKSSAAASGGRLVFVYLPQRERYLSGGISDESRQQIFQILTNLNIPLIDVHAAFHNHPDPLAMFPFRRGFHYNERGHELVADLILRQLKAMDVMGKGAL